MRMVTSSTKIIHAEGVVRIMVETENGIILDVDINQAYAFSVSTLTIWRK